MEFLKPDDYKWALNTFNISTLTTVGENDGNVHIVLPIIIGVVSLIMSMFIMCVYASPCFPIPRNLRPFNRVSKIDVAETLIDLYHETSIYPNSFTNKHRSEYNTLFYHSGIL